LAERVQHPPPHSTPPTPAADDEESSTAPRAASTGHALFDTMAKGMQYATEFRLPAVQLSQVFSALDRQLNAEIVTPPTQGAGAPPAPMPGGDVLIADLVKLAPPPIGQTAAEALGAAINVRHDVQLVPQQTGYSCWAAGAAMVVGWRDHVSVDPSEIARATGYWAQYQTGLNAEDTHMFNVFRLKPEAAQTYTVHGFADLLRRYGPLWVASAEPGPHVRVVTGMIGDGTPTGTVVYINDPWEAGMTGFRLPNRGAQYTETYQRFVEKQETLGRQEITQQGIYVAHA
ncbi:MAG: papain-like cysteine protease family protein, partial [Gemmatimonadaceae bacterium]